MMNYYTFYTFATYAYSCLICLLEFLIVLRHISLGADALVGTPSGVSKCDFSDNFVFKNSAQIEKLVLGRLWGHSFKNDEFDKKTSDVNFRGDRFCSFKRLYLSGKLQIEKSGLY